MIGALIAIVWLGSLCYVYFLGATRGIAAGIASTVELKESK